jgi:hypothetical protein
MIATSSRAGVLCGRFNDAALSGIHACLTNDARLMPRIVYRVNALSGA